MHNSGIIVTLFYISYKVYWNQEIYKNFFKPYKKYLHVQTYE